VERSGSSKTVRNDGFSISEAVVEAVCDAAISVLKVFAFVVFFNAVSAIIWGFTAWLPFFDTEAVPWLYSLQLSFFEFSSGVSGIASTELPCIAFLASFGLDGVGLARLLTVVALAWSGMSVHMQTAGFAASCGLSLRRYYIGKRLSVCASVLFYVLISFLLP
jgi:hypothetical protein